MVAPKQVWVEIVARYDFKDLSLLGNCQQLIKFAATIEEIKMSNSTTR